MDLIIAATAVYHGLKVLHYDRDFLTLQRVCGVETQLVAELGSLG